MLAQIFARLPEVYPRRPNSSLGGRRIVRRLPYIMAGELIVAASSSADFNPATFAHNEELPFEVISMVPQITCLDASQVPIVDPNIGSLYRYVQLKLQLIGSARYITKSASRLSAILPKDSYVYNLGQPLYLEKAEGFAGTVSNAILVASAAGGIRMEIGFHGNLLELE